MRAEPLLRSLTTGAACILLILVMACGSSSTPAPTTQPPILPSDSQPPPDTPAADNAAEVPEAPPEPVAPAPPMPEPEELGIPFEPVEAELTDEAEDPAEPEDAAIDDSARLEESLQAFESSEAFWQQGNFEDAFAALDRAYELMASVLANGDPLLAQQKEDLRHLISRRVVEIYASRQTTVGGRNGSIPLEINDEVRREIASFQGRERDFFLESYRRSGLYRTMILEELRKEGMPEELSWLPLVESGFKVRALSRARALGLWQFISSTGYRYGLERSRWVDERMDPAKSTRAALAYLTDLHNLFGDWMTALAAYNCGEGTVLKRIQNQPVSYFDRFWDLYAQLPRETRRYVPRFLAVLAILEDPQSYGFDLPEPLPPLDAEVVEIERPVELEAIEKAMSLPQGTLLALNPELRHKSTPDEQYALRVPPKTGETLLASLDRIPKWSPPKTTVHRVRRGDTLSGVAARYGTSVRALMDLNNLRSAHRIWPGQQLKIPGGGGSVRRSSSRALAPGKEVTHRVRPGDSLWRLANQYGTTVDRIKRDNGLRGNLLRPGQRLRIRGGGGTTATNTRYTVRRGDTLGAIAERHGVSLNSLLRANRLSRRSTIYPGQRLTIPR